MQQATQIRTTRQTPIQISSSGKSATPIRREDTRRSGSRRKIDDSWARRAMHSSGFGEAGF